MTTNLQPHQQRVVAEKADLDERLNKLLAFTANPIFSSLSFERAEPVGGASRLHAGVLQRAGAAHRCVRAVSPLGVNGPREGQPE